MLRFAAFLSFVFLSFVLVSPIAFGNPGFSTINGIADNEDEIEKWIGQLDDSSLTKRLQAKRSLKEAGKKAIPALTTSALSDKRETITHSIELLDDIANNSKDEETKKAARAALEMLSKSEKQSTAERARLALNSKKEKGIQAFPGWDKMGNEFARGGRNVSRSVSVSSINGVRRITVTERGTTTTFQDMPNGAIQVQIDDGEKPIKLLAKNEEDLKAKNPKAFELFKQVGAGNQNSRVGGFGFSRIGGNKIEFGGNLDATKMLEQQLNELKNSLPNDPTVKMLIDKQIESLKQNQKK